MVSISIYGEAEEVARFLHEMGYKDITVNGKKLEVDDSDKDKEAEPDLSEWRPRPVNPMKGYFIK